MPKTKARRAGPHPDLPPCHPGEILREVVLASLSRPSSEIARALGISARKLADIVNERVALTPEIAIRLEAAFGRSAGAWLRLQETYDLWHARRKVDVSGIPRLTEAA